MRSTVIGLVALPVVLAGVGIAGATIYFSGAPAPATDQSPARSLQAGAGSGSPSEIAGTSILGQRPHLTVHDDNHLLLAGSLAGITSARPISVAPLSDDAPDLRTVFRGPADDRVTTTPAMSPPAVQWSPRAAIPAPEPPRLISPAPLTMSSQPVAPPGTPPLSAAPGTTTESVEAVEAVEDTREDDRRDRDNRDASSEGDGSGWRVEASQATSGTTHGNEGDDDNGPPSHSRHTGRPAHADTTGPPPHANIDKRDHDSRPR